MGRTDRASRVIEAPLMFQSILKIKMVTVQVNGNEMAWVCENHFGAESNTQTTRSLRAKRPGTPRAVAGLTENSSPGT